MRSGKILSVLILLLGIPASGAEFLFSTKIQSQYIAGNGAVFHDKPVLQSDIFIVLQNGIYADIWHSTSLKFDNPNLGSDDEIDYSLGYSRAFGKMSIDVGALYMNFIDLEQSKGDAVLPYLELSRISQKKFSILPYVRFQPAFPVSGDSPKQGYYFGAGFNIINRRRAGSEIRHKISVIHDSGAFGYERNTLAEYKFELTQQMGKRMKLVLPSVSAYVPLSHPSEYDGRKTSVSVGTGLSISF